MTEDEPGETLRSFRVDLTLVLVGLFLALAVQNVIEYVETTSPHVSPYFYLTIGVASLLMVFLFVARAARIAGLGKIAQRGGS